MQGVSTRKVKAVTEALCGHSFSASSISAINKTLDESLRAFSERRLADPFPYLILDARYERIREGGVITNQAVLIAVAVDWEGRRQILAVELANRESRSSWRDFLLAACRTDPWRACSGLPSPVIRSQRLEALKGGLKRPLGRTSASYSRPRSQASTLL